MEILGERRHAAVLIDLIVTVDLSAGRSAVSLDRCEGKRRTVKISNGRGHLFRWDRLGSTALGPALGQHRNWHSMRRLVIQRDRTALVRLVR
jgi:hypothetical protein